MNNVETIEIKEIDPDMIAPSTNTYSNPDQGGSKLVVCGKPGCFEKGTLILMYNGTIKNVEDIKVGEKVMGWDSKPRTVLELCRNSDEMFAIYSKSRKIVVVNKNHILCLKNKNNELVEITVRDFLKKDNNFIDQHKWFRRGVEFSDIKEDDNKHFYNLADEYCSIFTNKFNIEDEIKINTLKNRIDFLQCVIDKYGHINYIEKCIEIIHKNLDILADLVFMFRSCGFPCEILHDSIAGYHTCCVYNITSSLTKSLEYVSDNLMDFCLIPQGKDNYYGFVLDGDHKFFLSDFSVVHNTGKCLAKGTPVLMYDGRVKKVEDIRVGELLMGDDSHFRTVLSTCRGMDQMYKVSQQRGDSYTVNSPHILSLKSLNGKIIDIPIEDYINSSEDFKSNYRGYKVGVDFPSQKTELDSYSFGYNSNRKDSGIKSIPDEYKINDRKNRLELLAGLLDSNSDSNPNRKSTPFYRLIISNSSIINDVIFIINSLGFSIGKKFLQNNETVVRIYGNLNEIPVRIRTKAVPRDDEYFCRPSLLEIKDVGIGEYYGFQLDGNHRFLLGDFTVTHNTTLIASLLYAKKHIIPIAMAMSGTEDSNHFYRSIFPSTFVYNTYDEEKVEDFIKRQKISKQHIENPWAVMILDDCTDEPALFRKPLQQGLYKRGRHWKMLYILSLQYGMDVRPVIRTNVDGVFILREPNLRNRKVMYENYAGIIPDFHLFCQILDQITDDYTALYIHNMTKTNNWKDCVFWYKARPIPDDFKFGCDEYWDFHYDRYDPEYTDPVTV